MKVAIDTRYDTLEEALAVVALAFETSAWGATRKAKRRGQAGEVGSQDGPKESRTCGAESTRHGHRCGEPDRDDQFEASGGNQEDRCSTGDSREEGHDDCATQEVDDPQGDNAGDIRDRCRIGHGNDGGGIEGSGDKNGLEERERQREREDEEGCRQESHAETGAAREAGQCRSPGPVRQDPCLGSVSRDAGR